MTNKKSIRKRLIFLFIGSIVVTHLLLAIGFQISIQHHFLKQDYQHIQDETLNVFSDDSQRKITQDVLDYYSLSKFRIWIINESQQNYKNSEVPLPEDSFLFLSENKDSKQPLNWESNGDTYRAFSFSVMSGDLLVAGLKINDHLTFARDINWMILTFLLFTASSAIAYGIFSVSNSLKPLKDFAHYLSVVSPGHLDVRIPAHTLPIELEELAHVQNKMLERLDSGFQRLAEFSSDIAHELRTPLSNMTTQTQVTLTRKRTFAEYEDVLIANIEELERINKTINDILYLAKSENELLHYEDQQLNPVDEITEIIEYLSIIGDDKQLNFELNGTSELYFDRTMFRRVLNNLLSNAVRHAAPGSIIGISISHLKDATNIKISNHGDTIPSESIPFIFDRFYRVDKSREHHHSIGAGLGLAITRSIIEAYQGRVTVVSEHGLTTFTVEIPDR
ncbi:MAG: heavy metal sensor histidine kinase [Thiolinea sp.]